MWWWLWSSGALAADCDPGEPIKRALVAWLGNDAATGRAALADAEQAWSCSAADPQELARYRILEGVALTDEGDREAAAESFAAARRIAPDMWLPDLSPALREAWSQAREPQGVGQIVLDPPAGTREVWVDGTALVGDEVAAGLHLVQVGAQNGDDVVFSTTVWVGPGVAKVVETRLPPAPPVVDPSPPTPTPGRTGAEPLATIPDGDRPAPGTGVELHGLVGGSTAIGTALASGDLREPGVKIAIPLELGVGVAGRRGFVRAQVGSAALIGGRWLATTADGEAVSRPLRIDAGIAGGVGDEVRFGAAAGIQWPSRLAGRLLVGWAPTGPLYGELRLGANLPTERAVEPAGELLVGFRVR